MQKTLKQKHKEQRKKKNKYSLSVVLTPTIKKRKPNGRETFIKKFSLLPIILMAKIIKLTNRSKKYSANFALVQAAIKNNKSEIFSVENAVKLILTLESPAFKTGPSMELHAKLNINPTKSDQLVRSSVTLPNGTGKNVIVAAFVNPENEDALRSVCDQADQAVVVAPDVENYLPRHEVGRIKRCTYV